MSEEHFTAWVVNDPASLDTGCMDVTVIPDVIGGYRDMNGEEEPVWSSDSTRPHAFHAVTSVDAKEGDGEDGCSEAETLMLAAGWRVVGEWDTFPNSFAATVERVEA